MSVGLSVELMPRVVALVENKVQSALPKIVTTGYHALDLVHFFTSGEDEVRAWTIRVCIHEHAMLCSLLGSD